MFLVMEPSCPGLAPRTARRWPTPKSKRRPWPGRRRAARHAWLPSVHLLCQSGGPPFSWRP